MEFLFYLLSYAYNKRLSVLLNRKGRKTTILQVIGEATGDMTDKKEAFRKKERVNN